MSLKPKPACQRTQAGVAPLRTGVSASSWGDDQREEFIDKNSKVVGAVHMSRQKLGEDHEQGRKGGVGNEKLLSWAGVQKVPRWTVARGSVSPQKSTHFPGDVEPLLRPGTDPSPRKPRKDSSPRGLSLLRPFPSSPHGPCTIGGS